jgi:hypothetical protein
MIIYLDSCVYNRPFDDQQQPRINLETQALLLILHMAEKKALYSSALLLLRRKTTTTPIWTVER